MKKVLLMIIALAVASSLGGCVVYGEHPHHMRHRDAIIVIPEHHGHHHWR